MVKVNGAAFDPGVLKRIIAYALSYKTQFLLTLFLTLLLGFLSPLRPYLIQLAVDDYILPGDYKGLNMIVLLIIGFLFAEGIAQFFQTYLANWLGQRVILDLRAQVYRKIIHFTMRFFDRTPIGQLVTRSVSDIETISEIFSQGLMNMAADMLRLVMVLAMMFWTDWKLTLICLSPIPLLLMATWVFKNAIKKAFQDVRKQVSRLNAFVQEHISGMALVQVFNREEVEYKRFRQINDAHRKAHIKSIWAYSIFFPVVEILSALSIALLIWWGSASVIASHLSPGILVAFILYIYMLFRPIRQLADRFNVLQMGMVAGERLFDLLDKNDMISNTGKHIAEKINGDIQFKQLNFAYNKGNRILKDLDFRVKSGERVAIVGQTGAGKSTIVNLLSRQYEFQKGAILIDDLDIRSYELRSLRRHVGIVLQEVFLFSDSIYNNIALYNPDITPEMVMTAARKVGADRFIDQLEDGLFFNVRERGSMLSTGQRQLVAFIRAYIYNPRILVLDEATSSVDSETEEMIQVAIEKLTMNRTSLIIAHRLATIRNADRILVIDNGYLVEQGTHEDLLSQKGHYHNLYEMQYKNTAG